MVRSDPANSWSDQGVACKPGPLPPTAGCAASTAAAEQQLQGRQATRGACRLVDGFQRSFHDTARSRTFPALLKHPLALPPLHRRPVRLHLNVHQFPQSRRLQQALRAARPGRPLCPVHDRRCVALPAACQACQPRVPCPCQRPGLVCGNPCAVHTQLTTCKSPGPLPSAFLPACLPVFLPPARLLGLRCLKPGSHCSRHAACYKRTAFDGSPVT